MVVSDAYIGLLKWLVVNYGGTCILQTRYVGQSFRPILQTFILKNPKIATRLILRKVVAISPLAIVSVLIFLLNVLRNLLHLFVCSIPGTLRVCNVINQELFLSDVK